MGHKIAEAIIEDREIKYIDKQLPKGRIRAHIIYDTENETLPDTSLENMVRDTYGIYKDINVLYESKKIREDWERTIDR